MNERWRLKTGDTLVGSIDVTGTDLPWFTGRFYPEPGFAEFGDLFKRVYRLALRGLDSASLLWSRVTWTLRLLNGKRSMEASGIACAC